VIVVTSCHRGIPYAIPTTCGYERIPRRNIRLLKCGDLANRAVFHATLTTVRNPLKRCSISPGAFKILIEVVLEILRRKGLPPLMLIEYRPALTWKEKIGPSTITGGKRRERKFHHSGMRSSPNSRTLPPSPRAWPDQLQRYQLVMMTFWSRSWDGVERGSLLSLD
jgi:hypothetical protein